MQAILRTMTAKALAGDTKAAQFIVDNLGRVLDEKKTSNVIIINNTRPDAPTYSEWPSGNVQKGQYHSKE